VRANETTSRRIEPGLGSRARRSRRSLARKSAHRALDNGERDAEPGGEVYGIRVRQSVSEPWL